MKRSRYDLQGSQYLPHSRVLTVLITLSMVHIFFWQSRTRKLSSETFKTPDKIVADVDQIASFQRFKFTIENPPVSFTLVRSR